MAVNGDEIRPEEPEEDFHNPNSYFKELEGIVAALDALAKAVTPDEYDDGTPPETDGTFDVFAGNPPYYSDYRIAEVFLDTARRALKPGGVCYTVCKNAAGLEPVQKKYFPVLYLEHK